MTFLILAIVNFKYFLIIQFLTMKPKLECPLCGTEVAENDYYCSECGETLVKKE